MPPILQKRHSNQMINMHSKRQKSEGLPSLLDAVKENYPRDLIQKIIYLGVNLEEKDSEGRTALMYAVIYNNLVLANTLISAGANIREEDFNGNSVLMHSISETIPCEFLQKLIILGADVSAHNDSNESVLLLACKKGTPDMIETLIKYGADLSYQNNNGESALIVATKRGSVRMITKLVSSGVHINIKDVSGQTALFKVQNEESLVLLLQAGLDPTVMSNFLNPLAHFCRAHKPLGYIKVLLDFGADTFINRALFEACDCRYNDGYNDLNLVKMLLEYGVNPSRIYELGTCALSNAVYWKLIETIKLLLAAGANPSFQYCSGVSLLMNVCQYQVEDIQILNALLKAGANVSAQDNNGKTALMFAIENGHINLTKRLIEVGANLKTVDKSGECALMRVCNMENPNLQLINFVVRAALNISSEDSMGKATALAVSFKQNNIHTMQRILKHSANVCVQDQHGQTILMKTCQSVSEEIGLVHLLISNSAHLSVQDNAGRTSLMFALNQGHLKIVDALIDAGANVSTQDNQGNTLLMMACKKGFIDIVKKLIEMGTPISTQNDKGESAAILAASANHFNLVCLLLDAGARAAHKCKNGKSIITYVFKNIINHTNHTDLVITLKQIIKCGGLRKDFAIIPHVIKECSESIAYCVHNNIKYPSVLKTFTKRLVQSAAKNVTNTSLLMHHQRATHNILMKTKINLFYVYKEIFDLIIQSPFKDVTWTGHIITPYSIINGYCTDIILNTNEIPCETVGELIHLYSENFSFEMHEEPFKILCNSLIHLLNNGFSANPKNPKVLSPLSILFSLKHANRNSGTNKCIFQIAQELIARGIQKCQRIFIFRETYLHMRSQQLKLPDALWLAFQNGFSSCLPLLIPYWSAPALALLMFVSPLPDYDPCRNYDRQIEFLNMVLSEAFDTLLEISGPLPPGHKYIKLIQKYLDDFAAQCVQAKSLSETFREIHSIAPPSLQQLCRHVIRGCTQTGDDLPQRLSTLVPPGLKSYLTLMN